MVGVLLLVLPSFIKSNKNLKTFFTNLSIWVAILLVLFSLYYLSKKTKIVYPIKPRNIPKNLSFMIYSLV